MTRYIVALIFALLTLALSSAAKERPAPAAVEPGRIVVSLDDAWSFAPDPAGQAPAGEWAAALPAPATVPLPHSWDKTGQGAAWYARDITFPGVGGPVEILLNLDHPVGLLDVFLDGKPTAQFHGNGLPQSVRLQGNGGSVHHLALRLERTVLPPTTRLESVYGLGHLSMELLPPVRIDALQAVMDPDRQTLTARYRLAAATPIEATLKLDVLAPGSTRIVQRHSETLNLTAQNLTGETVLPIKRMLNWSPREPGNIYRVHATLLVAGRTVDERELACGACAATCTGTDLLLNGQPFQLKGVRLPGGIPLIYTTTLEDTLRNELELARRAGFNAIMADGSALPEEVLATADALGMLVIGEIPPGDDAEPLIRPTLDACAQHPSIIAWSWAGAGPQATQIGDLRALDASRLILLRDGAQSRLIGPRATAGQAVTDLEVNLPAGERRAWWGQLEELAGTRQPVLATGLGVEMVSDPNNNAGIRGNTAAGDEALGQLRDAVESLRGIRQFPLLGYFVRLPDAVTLTGLSTPAGNPTNALTTALAFNQPCAIVMRVKSPVAIAQPAVLDAALVCDDRLQGDFQLYEVVTSLEDGKTAITSLDLELTGKTTRYDLLKRLSFIPDRTGEYRLQLVLSQGDRILASTQVARITVSTDQTAALVTSPDPDLR